MKFARRKIWINGSRCLCELEPDGSVTYNVDVSPEELKWIINVLLRDYELKRQSKIGLEGKEYDQASIEIGNMNNKEAREAALNELVRENQEQGAYDFKCPRCRCQPGCCCCREGFCGCKENQVRIDESKLI